MPLLKNINKEQATIACAYRRKFHFFSNSHKMCIRNEDVK